MSPLEKRYLLGRRRIIAIVVAALTAVAIWLLQPGRFSPPGPLVWSGRFQDYEARIYRVHRDGSTFLYRQAAKLPTPLSSRIERWYYGRPESAVEILRKGRRVFSQYGNYFDIPDAWFGHDVTGEGHPNICIAHTPFRNGGGMLDLFQCGENFTKIARLESIDFGPELQDLDNDGRPEVIVNDNAFYHWPVCRDGEPMPRVILHWQNGKYVPHRKLMRKVRTPSELISRAAGIRASDDWSDDGNSMPDELVRALFDLFYSGPELAAWEFLDQAWNPECSTKREWVSGWRGRLEESQYWPQLQNAWKVEPY